MSKSFRTQQPAARAQRRVRRDPEGEVVLPRILVRKPRPGDLHPITGGMLRHVLRTEVPLEYLYGLKRIELLPRASTLIGAPFGSYSWREQTITLYSLPLAWDLLVRPSASMLRSLRRFHAEIEEREIGYAVRWPALPVLALWFFIDVFAHELGHHYRNQYRLRGGRPGLRRHEEFVAELHSERFYAALVLKMRARRKPSPPKPAS